LYLNWLEVEQISWTDHRYHHLLITTDRMNKSQLTEVINDVQENLSIEFEYELRDFYELQASKAGDSELTHLYGVREEELLVDKLYYHKGYTATLHESPDSNVCVVEKLTAEIQGWEIDDELQVFIPNYGILNLTIIAMADSPEFMISPGLISEFYGRATWAGPVIWMKHQDLEHHINSSNYINQANQIALYFKNPSKVNSFLNETLNAMSKKYGTNSVLQYSGRDPFLLSISPTFSSMALILSFVFAAITGIMLFIVLKRILEEEITTLGIFKALGFSNREIVTSGIIYSWLMVLIGGIIGVVIGLTTGFLYGSFYIDLAGIKRLPNTPTTSILLLVPAIAFLLLIFVAITTGSLLACRRILRMAPIEAIRPQAMFKSARPVLLERVILKIKALSPLTKFSIRSVFQEKRKGVFTVVGIILAMSISIFGTTAGTSFISGINKQFDFYQAWDVQVSLNQFQNASQIDIMLENLTWEQYEPFIIIPIRLTQDLTQQYVITGLEPNTTSRNFDTGGVPRYQHAIITKDLAIKFGIGIGDNLSVICGNKTSELEVENILNEFTGGGVYTSIETARWLAGIPETDANGIFIHTTDSEQVENILKEDPSVQEIVIKSRLAASVREGMMVGYGMLMLAMSAGLIVGVAIAVTVVSISISERKHDFVNFRALGVSNQEIFRTVLLELIITSILGIFIGFFTGTAMGNFIFAWAAEFGVVLIMEINPLSTGLSILNILLAITLAAYLSLRALFLTSISEETVSRIIG
ncbi:MAG: FtsX-like permease family protein, partial [Promethearchaeota archaeon]